MTSLYKDCYSNQLTKERKQNIVFIWITVTLMVVSILVFLLLANYHNKLLYKILLSVFLVVGSFFLVYLISKFIYIKNLIYEFTSIKNDHGSKIEGIIESIGEKPITLADKSKVYEVYVKYDNESGKLYYLSEIFDVRFEVGKKYKFVVAYDYIKEFELDED